MVSVLFLLLKLPFWVLMAAEFFENSLAPGGFCWIIVAVGTLWIVTLFKHAELLCSSFYCRIWNGSKFQNHLYGEVHSNLCVQEGWGLGAPVLPPCVFALALCRSHLSRNRPVNHPKTHCWMLWLWTMFNHFSPFSWQRLHPIWGLFPSNVIIMYNHNNDHYNNNFGVLSPEQIIQNHIHDSRSLLTSDSSLLQHVTLAWLPILFG